MKMLDLMIVFAKAQKKLIRKRNPEKWTYDYIGKIFLCYLYKGRLNWNEIVKKIEDVDFLQKKHQRILGQVRKIEDKTKYFAEIAKSMFFSQNVEPREEYFFIRERTENDKKLIKQYIEKCESRKETIQKQKDISPDKKNKLCFYYDLKIREYKKKECDINLYQNKQIYTDVFQLKLIMWGPSYGTILPPLDETTILLYKKFSNKTFSELRTLIGECNSNQNRIYEIAKEHIKKENVVKKINDLINNTFFLSEIKKSLQKTMGYYSTDSYVFCLLAISQIEGLFYLYCKDLGCEDKQLLSETISGKVALLRKKKMLYWIDEDYFTIYFPIFRNRLMHGIKINDEWDKKASLILIDFYDALSLSQSKQLRFNMQESLISKLNTNYSYREMVALYAIYNDIHPQLIKLRDAIVKKYRFDLIKDVDDDIKKGKTDFLCYLKNFAESLSLKIKSEKDLRIKIFQNMDESKNKIEKWTLLAKTVN